MGKNIEEICGISQEDPHVGNSTIVADPTLVHSVDKPAHQSTSNCESDTRNSNVKTRSQTGTPHGRETKADSRDHLFRHFRGKGFSKEVASTMCSARSDSTFKQYTTYLQKWTDYCGQRKINARHPSLRHVLAFLESLKAHTGYSGISTAKAALGSFISFDGKPLGQNKYVNLYMTGLAKSLPRMPKYQEIWDPQSVLKFLQKWAPAKHLNLFQLTVKTLLLLLLVTAQRVQTMSKLSLDNMSLKKRRITFTITQNLKHQRRNNPATVIELNAFVPDLRLCPVNYLKAYINRTRPLRSVQDLFVTTTKPHGKAAMATLSRWTKTGLQLAGINVKKFGPGSTRAASANRALSQGVPVETILKQGCWAQETTFTKWYKKEIKTKGKSFQNAVLSLQK